MKKAILKKGKEIAISRRHPWIFSGAIERMDPCSSGDLVQVYDSNKNWLACGHVGDGSITIRVLSFVETEIDDAFWQNRIQNCKNLREKLNLGINFPTNAYRLIHGEGDLLPGLIVDIYANTAVIQAHTDGMYLCLNEISNAIQTVFGSDIQHIYSKSSSALHDESVEDEFLMGDLNESIATENHMKFKVNWVTGQKTGFFLDQRENRALLKHYAQDKTVLNTFSYSGGFSVAALMGGASMVKSVDISQIAVDLSTENVAINGFSDHHEAIQADVMKYLRDIEEHYDIVVLDPPAFAKSLTKKHAATMGYKRLNMLGLERVKPGGLLFTFSCSQVIDEKLFANTVTAAAIEVGRNCRILHRLGQGPDHPVNIFHPEGHYLKG